MGFVRANRTGLAVALAVVVAAYVAYAVDGTLTSSLLGFAWSFAVPLVLAALVGVLGERSGVINIGIEGQMLGSAFVAFFAAALSGSMLLGALAGMGTGLLLGAFLAWTTVKWRMDQIIAGVVLNIVATGLTSFFYVQGFTLPQVMPSIEVPLLSSIPLFGPVFFTGGPFSLFAIVAVLVIWFGLFHTRWGLRTRAVGEHPHAADTAGVDVVRLRLLNVTLAGLLAGAAGAYLSMEASSTFERGFTAGRGFLALAIMIFGAWHPGKAMLAALFFGLMSGAAAQLQASRVVDIPEQFVNLLPYVLTLVVLAVAAGRVRPPAAAGEPFVKGDA
ncbi:ABC transporter permease [Agilicoccus flavus]|uniref:ABC transporter permease n=1 Tax=Agilicoccus flavus TaxID=2775968 RepID=UPI001CF6593D|nr:ABC transporter permease [Agilicoccus flavus]